MSRGYASTYRIVLLATVVLGCFVAIGVRLVFLHVIDREELVRNVDQARRQIIVEHARRGDIVDSRNNILATSRSLIVLGVDPQSLRTEDEDKWPALAALIGMPFPEMARIFRIKTRAVAPPAHAVAAAPVPASKGLEIAFSSDRAAEVTAGLGARPAVPAHATAIEPSEDTVVEDAPDEKGERPVRWAKLSETIEESTYEKIQELGVKGVYGQRIYRRAYPHNSTAAHIIGYVNREGDAVTGIELFADFYLHGRDGWREGERDGLRRELAQFRTRDVPASDGYSVKLTIDATVQHMIEEELESIAAQYSPKKATIIVSDPRTGYILGLANYPTFNLNEYNKVPRDQMASMRNAAVADIYEPGSVFKIVAASAALNENLVTPRTMFDCSLEKIEYKGVMRNLPGEAHHFDHPLSVAQIVSKSSNRGAAQLAMLMGAQRFYDYASAFGFGETTGFPVGGEISGLLMPPDKWDSLTITRMPMGHSIGATAIQMHMAMGVIASGGYLLKPQIIDEVRDASNEVVYRYSPEARRRVISSETARTVARLLQDVVAKGGTAPEAAIANYEVAGKTGTTQKLEPITLASGKTKLVYSRNHHVVSFVGFLPASRPELAISVIVDDADARCVGGVAYGTTVAAPSFKRLAEQLITYRDIKPVYDRNSRPVAALNGTRR